LQWIATAPQNLSTLLSEERVEGSARSLIVQLIRESQALGYAGRIDLTGLEGAFGFYRKLGFDQSGGMFTLNPVKAQELLSSYGGKIMFTELDTEELNRLEAEAGPILAIPSLEKLKELEAYKVRRRAEIKALREQRQQHESNG